MILTNSNKFMTYRKTGQTGKELCRLWWTAQKGFQDCPSQPWFPQFIHPKVTPSNRENKVFSSSSFLPLPPVTPVQFYFSFFLISFLQIDDRSPSNRDIYVSKPVYWNNQHLTQWLAIKLQLMLSPVYFSIRLECSDLLLYALARLQLFPSRCVL